MTWIGRRGRVRGDADELVRGLDDEAHPGHERCREWMESIGEVDYNPARFEFDEINKIFASHAANAPRR